MHFDSKSIQNFAGYGACRPTSCGLPPGRTSAAAIVTEAVFGIESVVRVPGTLYVHDITVITGALVPFADLDGNRRPGRLSLEYTG